MSSQRHLLKGAFGQFFFYHGTKEQLIAADLASHEMFERVAAEGGYADRTEHIYLAFEACDGLFHLATLKSPDEFADPRRRPDVRLRTLEVRLRRRYPKVKVECAIQQNIGFSPVRSVQTIEFRGRRKDLICAGLWPEGANDRIHDHFGDCWISGDAEDYSYVFHHSCVDEAEVPVLVSSDRRRRWPSKKVERAVDQIWKRIATA